MKHLSTLRNRKKTSIPPVAASEKGTAQTRYMFKPVCVVYRGLRGLVGCGYSYAGKDRASSLMPLERATGAGKSPVDERSGAFLNECPQVLRDRQTCRNLGGPPPKAKYSLATDSERSTVKEVVKSSPIREVKSP